MLVIFQATRHYFHKYYNTRTVTGYLKRNLSKHALLKPDCTACISKILLYTIIKFDGACVIVKAAAHKYKI